MYTLRFAALCAAVVLLGGCQSAPTLPSYGTVPRFELTDQTGAQFSSAERLKGHVWVANFIFTTCMGPCPRMTSQMRQVRDATRDVPSRRLVSFTIDPARDTPEKLAEYGKRYKADPAEWSFLTGAQPALHHLSKNVFMLQDIDGSLQHSVRFVLVDQEAQIRGFYDSSDAANIQQLIADVKALAGS